MITKKVYFCRHCQSSNNETYDGIYLQVKNVLNGNQALSWLSLSKFQDLLTYEYDCGITEHGIRQIEDAASLMQLNSSWIATPPEVVFHSTLRRAKETCQGLIRQSPNLAQQNLTITETATLNEASLLEHIAFATLDARIRSFLELLRVCDAQTVLVVGHGFFFRRMLGVMQLDVRNCDVFASSVHFQQINGAWTADWEEPTLLARTPLSDPALLLSLLQQFVSAPATAIATDASSSIAGNTDNIAERVCRICHMSAAESPGLRMIRPCLCAGSLAHVHLRCLNQWRATSSSAQDACSVCKYAYRTRKSLLVFWLFSEYSVIAFTALFVLACVLLLGLLIQPLALSTLQIDVFFLLSSVLHIEPLWRQCGVLAEMIVYYHWLSPPLLRAMDTPFSNSLAVNWELAQHIRRSSFLMKYLCFCKISMLPNFIELVVVGGVTLGSLGILSCVTTDLFDIFNARRINLEGLAFRRLLGITTWLASAGSENSSWFLVYLGLLFGAREMYIRVSSLARATTQVIGEQILEYGASPVVGQPPVTVVD